MDEDHHMDADAMQFALTAAGVEQSDIDTFIQRIYGVDRNAPDTKTFFEVYGMGNIVAEANQKRRHLNLKGLNAFDLRTVKPDGTPWNFNSRSDRKLAKEMIDSANPDWLIGSPPCTAICIWNRQLNYKRMDPEKVKELINEGKRHLNFVCYL